VQQQEGSRPQAFLRPGFGAVVAEVKRREVGQQADEVLAAGRESLTNPLSGNVVPAGGDHDPGGLHPRRRERGFAGRRLAAGAGWRSSAAMLFSATPGACMRA
jgi:hypothetical protein